VIPFYDKSWAKTNSPFNNRTTAGPPIYIDKFLTFRKENTADQTCGNLEKNKRQQRGGWQGKVGGRRVHGAIEVGEGEGEAARAWPTARPTTGQIQRQLAHLLQSNHVCTATKLSTTISGFQLAAAAPRPASSKTESFQGCELCNF
jgi:hypothetical protein